MGEPSGVMVDHRARQHAGDSIAKARTAEGGPMAEGRTHGARVRRYGDLSDSAFCRCAFHLPRRFPYNPPRPEEAARRRGVFVRRPVTGPQCRKEPALAKRSPLAEKLDEVRGRIAAACDKAKRDPAEVTLIAVTKTAAPEQIREILQLGVGDLGESRVQVLTQRAAQVNEFFQRRQTAGDANVATKLRWHMIGHLQRNKVKPVLPLVHMIHSLDSLRLAEELDGQAAKLNRRVPILLQVNASEEQQKFGVA